MEARIRNSESFQQQMKSLHEAAKAFTRDSVKSDECWKAFDRLENEWSKYNIRYGEESYRLGFEDGVQLASEREIRAKGSVLDDKDMAHLVFMYDAVKKLNKLLLGEWEIHGRDGGVLEELDRVCCLLFTLAILPAQYKDSINMIKSYPPKIRQRVEELPQYKGMIKQRKKAHVFKKIFGLIFFVVNIYDLIVLDGGFCHNFACPNLHLPRYLTAGVIYI